MTITRASALFLAAATLLLCFGAPSAAEAGTSLRAPARVALAKTKKPKLNLLKLAPSVKFKAKGKLNKTTARINMYALVTVAGKTHRINIMNMGVKKKGKSVQVKRKIGKLKVSLKISWSGTRSLTIRGTARYLKFKVPMPPIKVRV